MTRVIVLGPREFPYRAQMKAVLDRLHRRHRFTAVIETDEPGVARMAGDWARERGLEDLKLPPETKLYRGRAGAVNNERMLAEADMAIIYGDAGPDGLDLLVRARLKGAYVYTVDVVKDWGLVLDRNRRQIEEE
jgi:hypothetical protein